MKTEYDDSFPTCERTCCQLRIHLTDINPAEITLRLAITPSRTRIKGKPFKGYNGVERITRNSAWLLTSENKVESKDLRRHLDWLLETLEPAKDQLVQLGRMKDVKMGISCVWWSAHGHGGPILNASHMRRMAALNLECGFDIYFFGNDFVD